MAADGSLLDTRAGRYVIAGAWRDPACELLQCFRPRVAAMVPHEYGYCSKHGRRRLSMADIDAYPLEGAERRAAEAVAWGELAPALGIPIRDRRAAFATCQPTPAAEVGRRIVDPDVDEYLDRCSILEGNPGCGKSTTLACITRELALDLARNDAGLDGLHFTTFPALVGRLLNKTQRDEALEACTEAEELIVDDVGASHVRPDTFAVNLFEEIIIAREAAKAFTVLSTNLTPARFRALFGERVYDRIRGEWGAWFNVAGPSLRGKSTGRR